MEKRTNHGGANRASVADLREEWEERAAILEYDAGMPRHASEARATQLLAERYGLTVGAVLAMLVATMSISTRPP